MAFRHKPGRKLGQWRLVEPLGEGGNGEVWIAENLERDQVALKVLRQRQRASEPYQRFVREIEQHKRLTAEHFDGILPLVDSYLPPSEVKGDAWLATSIATPIVEAVRSFTLDEVVAAVRDIAHVLSRLTERGIAHRDVKPENIYLYESRWVLGDLGLIQFPGAVPMTSTGRVLGPRFYLAHEMLVADRESPAHKADVFALAKVLWVLCTGQNYPPAGLQLANVDGLNLSMYVADPRARQLDELVEVSTRFDPESRPTAADFRDELDAWLRPPRSPGEPVALEDISKRIAAAMRPGLQAQEMSEGRRKQAAEAYEIISGGVSIIDRTLRAQGIAAGLALVDDIVALASGGWELWTEEHVFHVAMQAMYREPATSKLLAGQSRQVDLISGVVVRSTSEGTAIVGAAHGIVSGKFPRAVWQSSVRNVLPLGSSMLFEECRRLSDELVQNLPTALEEWRLAIERT